MTQSFQTLRTLARSTVNQLKSRDFWASQQAHIRKLLQLWINAVTGLYCYLVGRTRFTATWVASTLQRFHHHLKFRAIPIAVLQLYVIALLAMFTAVLLAVPLLISKYATDVAMLFFDPLLLTGIAFCVAVGWLAHRTLHRITLPSSAFALCAADLIAATVTILPVLFLVKAGLWAEFASIVPIILFTLFGQSIALCATRSNPTRLWGSATFGLAATLTLVIAGVRFDAQPVSTIATVLIGVASGVVLMDGVQMVRDYRRTLSRTSESSAR